MEEVKEIGVGSTVWVQNGPHNIRESARWRAVVITGETRVSWIFGKGHAIRKFPKKIAAGERVRWSPTWNGRERVAITEAERDGLIYVVDHAAGIAGLVHCCQDPTILRQIAALVGYTEGVTS